MGSPSPSPSPSSSPSTSPLFTNHQPSQTCQPPFSLQAHQLPHQHQHQPHFGSTHKTTHGIINTSNYQNINNINNINKVVDKYINSINNIKNIKNNNQPTSHIICNHITRYIRKYPFLQASSNGLPDAPGMTKGLKLRYRKKSDKLYI